MATMRGLFALNRVHCGDALEMLRQLPDECVQVCVTSPPYWGLRDYGVASQIGLEKTPYEYIGKMKAVFEEVRRVLRKDGTLWLNIGDSYYPHNGSRGNKTPSGDTLKGRNNIYQPSPVFDDCGLKGKDLCGIPWRVAFALQDAGWYLRSDIIWSKPNPMPESVTDRPTRAHEYLFLLAKSQKYYYNADAIMEPLAYSSIERLNQDIENQAGSYRQQAKVNGPMKAVRKDKRRQFGNRDKSATLRNDEGNWYEPRDYRNKRSVWQIPTMPYKEAHFATFPLKLVEPCVLAGSRPGDLVLDPFSGSGTTGEVALRNGRKFIGFDINEKYCRELALPRLAAAERGQTIEQFKAGQMTIFEVEAGKS